MVPRSSKSRFYYNRLTRRILRAYALFGWLGCLSISLAGTSLAAVARVVLALFAFAWLYVAWAWWGRTIGVEVNSDGIRVGRGFRRRFIPWSGIRTFRARDAFTPSLRAELCSGEQVSIALAQGRKMAWDGGTTRDIMGVLNEELATARRQELRS